MIFGEWRKWLNNLSRNTRGRAAGRKRARPARPGLEVLEDRVTPAVTAVFTAATNTLTITGDAQDNNITVSRSDMGGTILVNGGAVTITGDEVADVINTELIEVFGKAGNDSITIDEGEGPLPAAKLFGGVGNDTITGGKGASLLAGGRGADELLGGDGDETLAGGRGNDFLDGGNGNDSLRGGAGNDFLDGGDGDDGLRGGAGADSLKGSEGDDSLRGGGGNDTLDGGGGYDLLVGGRGADELVGGDGNDTLHGGAGNDSLHGGAGSDTAFMGAGHDRFVWNPGDHDETIEGQGGIDRLVVNGSDDNTVLESFDLSKNDDGQFNLNVDAAHLDVNGVEQVTVRTSGGKDTVQVNDLRDTDVTAVKIDLGVQDDGEIDTITVKGTNVGDVVKVQGGPGLVSVSGLAAVVTVVGGKLSTDRLDVITEEGDDVVNATGLAAGSIMFFANGGDGNDSLHGGAGADTLLGGDGNDTLVDELGLNDLDGGEGIDTINGVVD